MTLGEAVNTKRRSGCECVHPERLMFTLHPASLNREQRRDFLWRAPPPSVANQLLDLGPRRVPVDVRADPAAGPTYGRFEVAIWPRTKHEILLDVDREDPDAGRPAVWWLPGAAYMTKIFPFTRKVGAPHASTSVVSGSPRQIARSRATGSLLAGFFAFAFTAFFTASFFAAGFFFAVFCAGIGQSSACVRY